MKLQFVADFDRRRGALSGGGGLSLLTHQFELVWALWQAFFSFILLFHLDIEIAFLLVGDILLCCKHYIVLLGGVGPPSLHCAAEGSGSKG